MRQEGGTGFIPGVVGAVTEKQLCLVEAADRIAQNRAA